MVIKCPECNHYVNDTRDLCPHCGAILRSDNTQPESGHSDNVPLSLEKEEEKQISQESVCAHHEVSTNEDNEAYPNCEGYMADDNSVPNIQEPYEKENSSQNKLILPIIIGLLVLAFVGGGWWYYKSSNSLKKGNVTIADNATSADSVVSVDVNSKEYITNYLNDILPKAIKMEEQQAIEKYFTKEFADLYKKVEVRDSKVNTEGNIGFWDSDFWTGGQDGELASIKVLDISDLSQNKATALVQYVIKFGDYDDSKNSYNLYLVFENGNWLIDDFNSYKDGFKDYLKDTIEEVEEIAEVSDEIITEPAADDFQNSNTITRDDKSKNNTALAREETRESEKVQAHQSETPNKVYDVVEQMPSFPGGDAALMRFLSSNVRYPVIAEENGIQGKVVLTFVIERDGSISDVKVVKPVDPSLDKEAIRVIQSMPRWKAGTQNGQAVRTKYTMPITFRLQ